MIRRCSAVLLLALVVAMVAAFALPPKPKPARAVKLTALPCVAGETCQVVLSWTRPVNFAAATDTARTDWDQTVPSVFNDLRKTSPVGTADTLSLVSRSDGKPKSGVVTLCYTRAGWTGQACNAALAWIVAGEVPTPPVDTASGLRITPASVTLPPTPGLQQQFTVAVLFN